MNRLTCPQNTTRVRAVHAPGFRFAPRIRDVLDQRLFRRRTGGDYERSTRCSSSGRVNARLSRNWDEVQRVALHSPALSRRALRKPAYSRQSQIAAPWRTWASRKTVFILGTCSGKAAPACARGEKQRGGT
jgi:TnpA family transposase